MPEPKTFQIGDTVTWTSQAGGKSKTKIGKVIAIVQADIEVQYVLTHLQSDGFRLPDASLLPRSHESYLIQVGKSKRLYWPLVRYLEKVSEAFTLPNEMPKEGSTLAISKVTEKGYEMEWQESPLEQYKRETEPWNADLADDDPMLPGEGCGYDAVDVGDGSNREDD